MSKTVRAAHVDNICMESIVIQSKSQETATMMCSDLAQVTHFAIVGFSVDKINKN